MPVQTLIIAILLIALGGGAFFVSGSQTALMPAYPGILLAVLAVLAMVFSYSRKHIMHVAALIALLGALAPAAALAIRASQMSAMALTVNVGMLLLCAVLLVLMVKSFIDARRAA